jgi:hypothetical protein
MITQQKSTLGLIAHRDSQRISSYGQAQYSRMQDTSRVIIQPSSGCPTIALGTRHARLEPRRGWQLRRAPPRSTEAWSFRCERLLYLQVPYHTIEFFVLLIMSRFARIRIKLQVTSWHLYIAAGGTALHSRLSAS